MRDAHGHEWVFEPGGEIYEYDTFKCNHCGCHKRIALGEPQNICKKCMAPICDRCYGTIATTGCVPEEKYLDQMEKAITRRLDWERNFHEMN